MLKHIFRKFTLNSYFFVIIFLIIFKIYALFFSFGNLFDLSFSNLFIFLMRQDYLFFSLMLVFLAFMYSGKKILHIISFFLFHLFALIFLIDILVLIFFQQRFFIIEMFNLSVWSSFSLWIYYIIVLILLYILLLSVSYIIGNICLKIFHIKKSFIKYWFYWLIILWLVGGLLSWDTYVQESKNIIVNNFSDVNVLYKQITNKQLNKEDKRNKIIKDFMFKMANIYPQKILSNLDSYKYLQDQDGKFYIKDLLLIVSKNTPELIVSNYSLIQNLIINNENIWPVILEQAVLNTSSLSYDSYFSTTWWLSNDANVILLFLESFSSVDSYRVSTIKNNFPKFDEIQKDWITFSNFSSNAQTSERAHVALLEGIEPLTFFKSSDEYYHIYKGYTEPLPVFFNNLWYSSFFVSTVTLDFLNQRRFLENIWFSNIIWPEMFSGEKSYTFDAAPDHVLYQKMLNITSVQTGKYFLVGQTISSHTPYNTPYWLSEKNMFKYVDDSLYDFYQQLKNNKFFDNWILILVSDHRKRDSFTNKEISKYGKAASTKILATIVGKNIPNNKVDDNLYQHIDVFYSLKKMFANWDYLSFNLYNDLFTSSISRNRGIKESGIWEDFLVFDKEWTTSSLNFIDKIPTFLDDNYFSGKYDIITYINSLFDYQTEQKSLWSNLVKIISHRWTTYQENSLKSFQEAINIWVDWLEFDVSFSQDLRPFVYHGPSMTKTLCDNLLNIYQLSSSELLQNCKLLDGQNMMTLEKFFAFIADKNLEYLFLDLKIYDINTLDDQVKSVVDLIYKYKLQDLVIITSYNHKALQVASSYNNIHTAWDTYDPKEIYELDNTRYDYFMTDKSNISPWLLYETEKRKKNIVSYVVNSAEEAKKLYDMWVWIFMTDNISLLKSWKNDL